MISPLRFGNIHVIEPLVYERFTELLEANRKNVYASPTTEPNNPAMNFLADVTGEEDVRDGYNKALWQCYHLPEGKALLLTDSNGGHYREYMKFRDEMRQKSPSLNLAQIAQAYIDSLPARKKIHVVSDEKTTGLTATGVPGYIFVEPNFQKPLKLFKALGFPARMAETFSRKSFDRHELLERYIPRLTRAFGAMSGSFEREAFVESTLESIHAVFGEKFMALKQKMFAAPFVLKVIEEMAKRGHFVETLSDYTGGAPRGDGRDPQQVALGNDLMNFAEQLIRMEQPEPPEKHHPVNRLEEWL